MKILGIFFQLICLLALLLAGAVYATGNLQCTFNEFTSAFTPEKLQQLVTGHLWVGITAGALLLLACVRGLGIVWNLLFSLACLAFLAEISLMLLGSEYALPAPLRGMGWDSMLSGLTTAYPVAALLIPAICVLGSFCSTSPGRISLTAIICYALCYGCAELFHFGMLQWMAMPEPPMDGLLAALATMPWLLAAIPAAFFLQYCLLMALFEAFDGKKKDEVSEEPSEAPAPEEPKPTPTAKPAPTRPIPALGKPAPIAKPAPAAKPVVLAAATKPAQPATPKPAIPSVPVPAPAPVAATKEAPKPDEPKEETVKAEAPTAKEASPAPEAKAEETKTPERPQGEKSEAETKTEETKPDA